MTNYDDCDSYVRYLRLEHHRLEAVSASVSARFRLAADASWHKTDKPDLAAKLAALRYGLSKHIDEEDKGGCVEEAVSRRPSLSQEARRVYQESDVLSKELAQIMELVAGDQREEAAEAFDQFAIDLRLHDQHEEQLVEKGMNWFPHDA